MSTQKKLLEAICQRQSTMAKLDLSKLELTTTGYAMFQSIFNTLYEDFTSGKTKIRIRTFAAWTKDEEEKKRWDEEAGSFADKGYSYGYFHIRRTLLNLNLQGFVKVYKRKPPKPVNWKPGDKIYSYLEIYPTLKGFKAYKHGAKCKIVGNGEIGIGKGYPGKQHLFRKYFMPVKELYNIAISRWSNWIKKYDSLWNTKLCSLTEEEAKPLIEELIQQLVPTLPHRYKRIQRLLEKSQKLEKFITSIA